MAIHLSREIFNELRQTNETIGNHWNILDEKDSVTYPYTSNNKQSEPILFSRSFPTESGKTTFVPAKFQKPMNSGQRFPFVFVPVPS